MYIIDLKDWMSNKGKYGYQKWANKKENKVNDDKKNVIVTMYLNAVTKTYDGGRNNYHAKGLNTKEKWKNATQHMRMAGYPEEYDQHYNIPVEFKFQVDDKQTPSHLIIESRVANGSTTYAKTYTNSQFQWAGSNVVGATKKMNESFGGYYHDITSVKNKQFKNSINKLLPAKMIPVIIELSGIDPDKKVNEISKEERNRLLMLFKKLPVTLNGPRGYNEAIITKGGIKVKEINPSTMESKLVNGLYFAGEVLDLDAYTGGFNLQIAWSTGYLAGTSAAV